MTRALRFLAEAGRLNAAVERLSGQAADLIARAVLELDQGEPEEHTRPRGFSHESRILKSILRPVSLELRPEDGQIVVDGVRVSCSLPPALMQLVLSLATRERGADSMPTFSTLAAIAAQLQINPRAATQRVFRLRKRLVENGLNPFLVESHGDAGVRLFAKDVVIVERRDV